MLCLHGGRGEQGTVATQQRRAAADNGRDSHAGRWERAGTPATVIKAGEATYEQQRGGFVIMVAPIVVSTYQVDNH